MPRDPEKVKAAKRRWWQKNKAGENKARRKNWSTDPEYREAEGERNAAKWRKRRDARDQNVSEKAKQIIENEADTEEQEDS